MSRVWWFECSLGSRGLGIRVLKWKYQSALGPQGIHKVFYGHYRAPHLGYPSRMDVRSEPSALVSQKKGVLG